MRDLFTADLPEIRIDKPIRLIELFGGYGSQFMALKRIGAEVESWVLCEFDDFAVKSFNAIHGTDYKPSDVRELHGKDLNIVNKDKFCYLMFYSFPCTDLSLAGKMQGMSKADWESGKSTRSGLLWEVERILGELPKEDLPQVLCMENVPQVVSDANIADFRSWQVYLEQRGYHNYLQILNAKDYGVAQNRERCFMFSFLDDVYFEFPEPVKLEKRMKDYLEDEVDEKYYLKSEKARLLIKQLIDNGTLERATSDKRQATSDCGRLTGVSTIQKSRRSQTVSRQGMTRESATCNQRETAYLNYRRIDQMNTNVAKTLCARDYKGFGTGFDTMNGVIEWDSDHARCLREQ